MNDAEKTRLRSLHGSFGALIKVSLADCRKSSNDIKRSFVSMYAALGRLQRYQLVHLSDPCSFFLGGGHFLIPKDCVFGGKSQPSTKSFYP